MYVLFKFLLIQNGTVLRPSSCPVMVVFVQTGMQPRVGASQVITNVMTA